MDTRDIRGSKEFIDDLESGGTDDLPGNKDEKDGGKKNSVFWEIMDYVKVILIGAAIAALICTFVIINAKVPTESMNPTVKAKDRLIGMRVPYYFKDPARGDIIIFKCPAQSKDYDKLYIKRVIGLPGETVRISAGQVWITTVEGDEFCLEEDYLREPPRADLSVNNASYVLGEDEYFVMGDNRNHSNDSRYWGCVTRDRIKAKAVFKYYKGFEILD